MNQRIPFLRGKGDVKQLRVVLSTVCAINFYGAILYSGAVLAWSFFVTEAATAKALVAFSPVVLLVAWLHYAKEFSLATGLYGFRSQLELVHTILTMLFSVVLVHFWGIYGAIVALGISTLIALVLSARTLWSHFALTINWRILWGLMVTGLPIMVDIMLPITMANADRILIAAMLSREILGIYSVGNAGVSILGMIPSAIGQILFVKFAEMDGQNKTKEQMSDVLDRTTVVLSSLFAPMLSVAIACFPVAVVFLLPQYVRGIAAGRLLIAGLFFLGVSLPVAKWCVSTGRFLPVLALRLGVVAIEFVAVYVVIRHGARLEWIALCVLCAFALFSTAMIVVCNHLLENPFHISIRRAGKSVLPFCSILAVLGMQDVVYPIGAYVPDMHLFVSGMLGLVVSLAVSIPFVYWTNRRTRVLELLLKRAQ
jgi:O-antigen/teichoic acid export membrane protein